MCAELCEQQSQVRGDFGRGSNVYVIPKPPRPQLTGTDLLEGDPNTTCRYCVVQC